MDKLKQYDAGLPMIFQISAKLCHRTVKLVQYVYYHWVTNCGNQIAIVLVVCSKNVSLQKKNLYCQYFIWKGGIKLKCWHSEPLQHHYTLLFSHKPICWTTVKILLHAHLVGMLQAIFNFTKIKNCIGSFFVPCQAIVIFISFWQGLMVRPEHWFETVTF